MFWSHPNITEECEQYVSAKGGLGTVTSWFARELRGFTSFACTSFHAAPGGILLLPKGVCNLFGGLNSFFFCDLLRFPILRGSVQRILINSSAFALRTVMCVALQVALQLEPIVCPIWVCIKIEGSA